jgi:hypothetical protein
MDEAFDGRKSLGIIDCAGNAVQRSSKKFREVQKGEKRGKVSVHVFYEISSLN